MIQSDFEELSVKILERRSVLERHSTKLVGLIWLLELPRRIARTSPPNVNSCTDFVLFRMLFAIVELICMERSHRVRPYNPHLCGVAHGEW